MEDKILKSKLARYIDAGFPIIYMNTFEEDKVDELVDSVSAGKRYMNGMKQMVISTLKQKHL